MPALVSSSTQNKDPMSILRNISSSIRAWALLFVVILHGACSPSQEYSFQCDGVQLTCPLGWAITDNEDNGVGGYYVSVEKDGWDSSGLMSISWINENVDLDSWFIACREDFVSEYQMLGSDFDRDMSRAHPVQFGRYSGLISEFTSSFFGVDHEGTLFCFQAGGKAFFILRQEALEDHYENTNGFRIIESSFTCQ